MQVGLNLSNVNQFKNNNVRANKNNSPTFTSKVQYLEGATKSTEEFLVDFASFTKQEAKNCMIRFKNSLEKLTNQIDGTILFAKSKISGEMPEMSLSYITKEGKELSFVKELPLTELCDNEISIIPSKIYLENPFERTLDEGIDLLSKILKENNYPDNENPFLQLQNEILIFKGSFYN